MSDRLLPGDVWNYLRNTIIKESGRKCQICDETKGAMQLHEIWNCADAKHAQKLDGFILLCDVCHHVRLIDLTGILANEGKLDYDVVVKPFCKVNGCSKKRFDEAFSSRE